MPRAVAPEPRPLADLLVTALPQLGERLAEQRLRQAWRQLVGPDAARRAQPVSLVGGCLTIVVDNSPWLHELTLRQAELTERIRVQHAGVRSVKLILGTLPPDTPAPPVARPPRPAPLADEDRREIDEATTPIRDEALAAAARRLLTRARQSERGRGAAR